MKLNITKKKSLLRIMLAGLGVGISFGGFGQIKSQPYSYHFYQKMNDVVYSTETKMHTSAKPFVIKDSVLLVKFDSIQSNRSVSSSNWFMRKIFNEHLVQVEKDDYTFYADFLPDLYIGKDMQGDKRRTWMNSRGFQVGLNVGNKFTFNTSAFESQAVFPKYLDDYIVANKVIPGQGNTKFQSKNKMDWMYATASMTYDAHKYVQATLAYDKNFIGDGYRSMLLSDFSSNYAHLKLTGTIGNVQYTSIWAYMNDPTHPRQDLTSVYPMEGQVNKRLGDGKKWGAFQYLDWNVTNKLSVGFFQSVVWAAQDDAGKRGFDFSYLSPIIFIRPVENNNRTSPDKMFLGLTSKYKLPYNLTAYGQFLLGEFTAKEFFAGNGYAHNKWGAQLGVRGYHMFGVKNLNFLAEYNTARPYTYAHFKSYSNYSNNAEPLAHPKGANFREIIGLVNYAWDRWDFSLQGMFTQNGLDLPDGSNMGGNIFQSYNTIPNIYGNHIAQGIKNNIYYADAKAAYVLNPKYNLRLELGYTQRYAKAQYETPVVNKSGVVSFGLRSSFRAIYNDL